MKVYLKGKVAKWFVEHFKVSHSPEIRPIIKCQAFRSGMNEDQIKRRLIINMVDELMQYAEFTLDVQENNISIITARLDVIKR